MPDRSRFRRPTGVASGSCLLALLLGLAGPAGAQAPADPPSHARWHVALLAADASSSMDDSLRAEMLREGLPEVESGRHLSWLIDGAYFLRGWLGVGVLFSSGAQGTVGWFKPGPNFFTSNEIVDVEFGTTTMALLVRLRPLRWLHVEAGPARHAAWAETIIAGAVGEPDEVRRYEDDTVGAVAGAGLSVGVWGALRVEGRAQYRTGGTLVVESYEARDDIVFGPVGLEYQHWYFGLGLGLAF